MDTTTKIHLSTLERELLQNKEWFLTKRSVIDKVYLLFGSLLESYKFTLDNAGYSILDNFKKDGGKISRGENYNGLPYVIMDYPAFFTKKNVCAVRTFFWWGNFFSLSLHLSGTFFPSSQNLQEQLRYFDCRNFFICINETQWQHDFDVSNYIMLSDLDEYALDEIFKKGFLKISKKIDVNQWEEVPGFLEKTFEEIIGFLQINFPAGETALLPGFPKAGSGL